MVALNIFDPIVIIVLNYTVLITLVSLFNSPNPSSFLILITLAVVTSYVYYKVNNNQPILIPVCMYPETTTMYPETTTMPPETTTMPPETTTTLPPTPGPITTLPTI
jgi:hypothetical protein